MINRKIVYFNVLVVVFYVCNYMSSIDIMNYVNDPYTNEWLLLFFNNQENFSMKPLFNIEISTLNGFIFLCIDLILTSIYAYTSYEK